MIMGIGHVVPVVRFKFESGIVQELVFKGSAKLISRLCVGFRISKIKFFNTDGVNIGQIFSVIEFKALFGTQGFISSGISRIGKFGLIAQCEKRSDMCRAILPHFTDVFAVE